MKNNEKKKKNEKLKKKRKRKIWTRCRRSLRNSIYRRKSRSKVRPRAWAEKGKKEKKEKERVLEKPYYQE